MQNSVKMLYLMLVPRFDGYLAKRYRVPLHKDTTGPSINFAKDISVYNLVSRQV